MGISLVDRALNVIIEELRERKPNTKYQLIKCLLNLGRGWHSYEEIKEQTEYPGLYSHLFDNLIELTRLSFLESDFKQKKKPRLTSFRIVPEAFDELALICI